MNLNKRTPAWYSNSGFTMHYNTVYQVLAIFTLFATATAVYVPPPVCQGPLTSCVSYAQCCSKLSYISVVSLLTSFFDLQVACAHLSSALEFEVWRHVQAASTTVKKIYSLCVWVGSGLRPSQDIFGWSCIRVREKLYDVCWNGQIIDFGWNCEFASEKNWYNVLIDTMQWAQ